jgi:hypothetical protein
MAEWSEGDAQLKDAYSAAFGLSTPSWQTTFGEAGHGTE